MFLLWEWSLSEQPSPELHWSISISQKTLFLKKHWYCLIEQLVEQTCRGKSQFSIFWREIKKKKSQIETTGFNKKSTAPYFCFATIKIKATCKIGEV